LPLPASQVIYIITSPSSNGTLKLRRYRLGPRWIASPRTMSTMAASPGSRTAARTWSGRSRYSVSDGGPNRLFTSFQVEGAADQRCADGLRRHADDRVRRSVATRPRASGASPRRSLSLGDVDNAQGAGKQTGTDNTEGIPDQLWFRVTTLPLDGTLQRWDGSAWVAYTDTDHVAAQDAADDQRRRRHQRPALCARWRRPGGEPDRQPRRAGARRSQRCRQCPQPKPAMARPTRR
jgi:hypothetical protein